MDEGGGRLLESRTSWDGALIVERRSGARRGFGQPATWTVIRDSADGAVLADLGDVEQSRVEERKDGTLFLWLENRWSKRLIRIDPVFRRIRDNESPAWRPLADLPDVVRFMEDLLASRDMMLRRRSYGPDARLALDMEQKEAGLGRTWYVATLYADGRHVFTLAGRNAQETWLDDGGLRLRLGPPDELHPLQEEVIIDPAGEKWRSPDAGNDWRPIATLGDFLRISPS